MQHFFPEIVEIDYQTWYKNETQAIKQLILNVEKFQQDAQNYASLFTEDALIIYRFGHRIRGKKNIAGLVKNRKSNCYEYDIEDIHLLSKEYAMVECIEYYFEPDQKKSSIKNLQTLLLVKENNWKVSRIQNTQILRYDLWHV